MDIIEKTYRQLYDDITDLHTDLLPRMDKIAFKIEYVNANNEIMLLNDAIEELKLKYDDFLQLSIKLYLKINFIKDLKLP